MGNTAPLSAPADLFTCSDSDIVISAYLPHHWRALLECLGLVELGEDERFATGPARARNRAELYAVLAAVFSRSEEHTSELQSLMRISYAVFCLKKKKKTT